MSRLALALVGLAQAVASATSFPHQPVPASFRERIAAAVKDVTDAAADPINGEAILGEGLAPASIDMDTIISGVLSDEGFASALVEKLFDKNPPAALVKALTAKVGPDLVAAVAERDKRLEALEAFAEKVDTDIAARLSALEEASAKSAGGTAAGDFEARLTALEDAATAGGE